MDILLQSPCNICALVNRKRSFHRRFQSANTINYSFSSSNFRLKPTSELQMPIGVTASPTTTLSQPVPTHKVTVHDRQRDIVHEFFVPEDQYILHTAESQDISLPFACRHGCCTSCAVRIKSGEIRQPEALGISAELRSKGYALLCVGFPTSDIEVETQDEDEMQIVSQKLKRVEITTMSELAMILKDMMYSSYQVYWLQFGRYFARGPIERDDYALELAMGDE